MTVISLTTVGYGEVIEVSGNRAAQIYTMVLITFGMGILPFGIIITLPAANDNLYITMSARMHNRKIRIIARMIDQKLEPTAWCRPIRLGRCAWHPK